MKRDAGFTLIEVLIAMLIGTIGLMGTIAVQQSIMSASKTANDAAIAMRLASQKMEELYSRSTDTQTADQLSYLAGAAPKWWPTDASSAQVPEYVDAQGFFLCDNSGVAIPPQPSEVGRYRWRRQWKVANSGSGLPYVISVIVTYNNDVGDPKTTRLDLERRKSW